MDRVPKKSQIHHNYFAGITRSAVEMGRIGRHSIPDSIYPKFKTLATQNLLPVSVCMIAGAEAPRIRRALDSVGSLAREIIVVVNAEVKDGTEEIARSVGAKVFREAWKGHVAQKNSAAEKATEAWLLGLDADEVVSPELLTELRATLGEPARTDGFAAFSFPRRSWYCGRWIGHGDWYPDRQTRLWRTGCATWGGLDPHDKLIVRGRVGKLRSDLHHFSNESIARQIAKISPYHQEYVRQRIAKGRSANWMELTARPCWRFIRAYFLRLGFLDGWQGFYIAALSSFSTLTRYALVREAAERDGSQG